MRTRQNLDLILIVALAVAQLGLSFVSNLDNPVRVAIGVVAVVFAPGYALVAAVWPEDGLPGAERLALSLGLSLSLATLGGLILYAIGVGLWPVPWAVLLGAPMLVGSGVAFRRRARRSAASPNGFAKAPSAARPTWLGMALGGGAAAVSVAAVALAVAGASRPNEDFSQLWLLPVNNASGSSVEVGLRSQELAPTTFHVQVLDGQSVALDTPDVRLAPGQTWTTTVPVTPTDADPSTSTAATGDDSIQALVYRSDAPDTPYRRVALQPASAAGQ